jgi:hypothetical protein
MARKKPKLYTVEEARALVPRLRELLRTIQATRRELDEENRALQEMSPAMRGNGHAPEAARREAHVNELARSLRNHIAEISALDIEVKDLDTGLVDFLSERDGRIIYLCWRMDEPTVSFWHELDGGFRGRQPLES